MSNAKRAQGRNWLVTGGAGFIGVNLIRALLRQSIADQIRVVDDLSTGSLPELERCGLVRRLDAGSAPPMGRQSGLELAQISIADADAARRLAEGADVIVHLAANTVVQDSIHSPIMDAEKNVFGILNYLDAAHAAGVSSVVFASSAAPTGRTPPPIHEEVPRKPMSPYGVSKMAGEGYCFAPCVWAVAREKRWVLTGR